MIVDRKFDKHALLLYITTSCENLNRICDIHIISDFTIFEGLRNSLEKLEPLYKLILNFFVQDNQLVK